MPAQTAGNGEKCRTRVCIFSLRSCEFQVGIFDKKGKFLTAILLFHVFVD
jgi:hypothetical protein